MALQEPLKRPLRNPRNHEGNKREQTDEAKILDEIEEDTQYMDNKLHEKRTASYQRFKPH